MKETKIIKIKTVRNILPSKSNPPPHLCSKDISEILAGFKYFTLWICPGFIYKLINQNIMHIHALHVASPLKNCKP